MDNPANINEQHYEMITNNVVEKAKVNLRHKTLKYILLKHPITLYIYIYISHNCSIITVHYKKGQQVLHQEFCLRKSHNL